jgi:peptidoglycan/xylan/chitin deacetylase (PgdA/CDA1 family)
LKSAGIPATLFIASDSIGSQRELWWDELERVFFEVQIPRSLSLEIQGQQYTWEITTPADRTPTLMAVHQKLKYLPYAKRQEIQKYLLAWADIPAKGRPDYLLLDASGIVEISQDGLVEIGAHTVTHQALSSLSRNEQRDEIVLCRQPLEAIYGKPVRTFAYPYGKEADFTVDTMNIVRKSGYALACSTIPGCIESGDNPYQLNRFGIHNWDDKTFKQLIEDMFVA